MPIFNPFLPSFRENPYPAYARLRVDDPVHWSPALQVWVLTAYDDCVAVMRDQQTFSSDPRHAKGQLADVLRERRLELPLGDVPVVLNVDPPVHTRLRSIVNRAFTPREIEGLRPRVEEISASLLGGAGRGERLEVMSELAEPLPVIVIAELLGVPPSDRDLFKRWSNAIAATTSVVTAATVVEAARRATQELVDYLGRFVEGRRASPREDLISLLVRAEASDDALSPDELLAFCILLLVAGNETTTNLIGNGMLALLQAPEQWALLRSRPHLLPGAIDELLRFDSPAQGVVRFARTDVAVDAVEIAEGEAALALIGAANRDPGRFPRPEALEVEREATPHLSFGMGIHYCLGARWLASKRRSPSPRCWSASTRRRSSTTASSVEARSCCGGCRGWRSPRPEPRLSPGRRVESSSEARRRDHALRPEQCVRPHPAQ